MNQDVLQVLIQQRDRLNQAIELLRGSVSNRVPARKPGRPAKRQKRVPERIRKPKPNNLTFKTGEHVLRLLTGGPLSSEELAEKFKSTGLAEKMRVKSLERSLKSTLYAFTKSKRVRSVNGKWELNLHREEIQKQVVNS